MPIGFFSGRVLPSGLGMSLGNATRIRLGASEFGGAVVFTIAIINAEIDIDCEVEEYQDDRLGYLHARAFDLARACVDVVAFGTGQGMTVILDTFTKPDGTAVPLAFAQRSLAAECTVYKIDSSIPAERAEFTNVLHVVAREPHLFMILNDLIQTLSLPHQAATNCGRVLDGLRKLVAPNVDPLKGWRILQGLLNVDGEYMEMVSETAKKPRHGDKSPIGSGVIQEVMKRTWGVMNRFIEYRKRGNQPLPADEFPLLKSSNFPS
jgi:hypothetical protein